ncbi:SRPBCC family protein [Marinococcus sp. PL1-022]|uniref:SRPBCC family protein n=1 Tax=Marinococcus sp. PL1-022 TaxID=3095363 RepID=UPI0029C48943|nr:SRPBCC family protein [Marinococcus sp. PL1-022]MDX6152659.1 SRPBCC family protein [Marinococcus sp. PL1-022]
MFTVSKSMFVNDSTDHEPILNHDHVWEGLVMKAEDATPFVEVMTACRILERGDRFLRREVEVHGHKSQEWVTFFPKHMIVFEPLDGPTRGLIKNEIEEDEQGALAIRFTFTFELAEDETMSEQAYAKRMEDSYTSAVETTLATIRSFVQEGKL